MLAVPRAFIYALLVSGSSVDHSIGADVYGVLAAMATGLGAGIADTTYSHCIVRLYDDSGYHLDGR